MWCARVCGQPVRTPDREDEQTQHARSVLEPLEAGERSPHLVEDRDQVGADTPLVREEVPRDVRRDTERERDHQ